jgi:hypothetical protein
MLDDAFKLTLDWIFPVPKDFTPKPAEGQEPAQQ